MKVQEILSTFFDGRKLDHQVNPDEAVASGAAILADQLKKGNKIETGGGGNKGGVEEIADDVPEEIVEFNDVTSINQGIEAAGGKMSIIIKANTQLPFSFMKAYTNGRDGQDLLAIRVFQGESDMVADNQKIGDF